MGFARLSTLASVRRGEPSGDPDGAEETGMIGASERSLGGRRGHVLLLLACGAFLVSGPVRTQLALDAAAASTDAATLAAAGPAAERIALVLERANPSLSARERARIGAAIDRYSAAYALDPDLVLAVMLVESNARPWAHSPKGAVGLMQVMPHMMEPMGLAGNLATIESNIEAGCAILSSNIRRLGVEDGISAYFWGSDIRGVAYLEKVLEARERVRERVSS